MFKNIHTGPLRDKVYGLRSTGEWDAIVTQLNDRYDCIAIKRNERVDHDDTNVHISRGQRRTEDFSMERA